MPHVTSRDSTKIDYHKFGDGPALIIVGGAMGSMAAFGERPELVQLAEPHFTVYNYDRRGRGKSTDTLPYSVGREVEDIEALIDAAGGTAGLVGFSSGACLAMEAAAQLGRKVS